MTAALQCRLCRASLSFPESMAGKTTTCPQCGERLVVPLYGGPSPTSPPAPPPGTRADLYPPGMGPPISLPPRAPSLLSPVAAASGQESEETPELPPAAVPTVARSAASAPPPPLPPSPPVAPPPVSSPPLPVSAAPVSRSAAPPPPPAKLVKPSHSTAASSPLPPRATQTARFIAADPNALRVPLGADGKLPSLLLEDVEQAREEEVAKPKDSPPWMLLTVFGVSIAMSLALLFIEPQGSGRSERISSAATREQLQLHYAGVVPPLAPLQQKIRLALQAHQKGDREEERRLYREVLDILHSESKNKSTGVTGMIDAPDPPFGNPSDRHLEELISTLLGE